MECTAIQGGPGHSHTHTLATRLSGRARGRESLRQASVAGWKERVDLGLIPLIGLSALSMPTFGTCPTTTREGHL